MVSQSNKGLSLVKFADTTLIARKPVIGVFDQIRINLGYPAALINLISYVIGSLIGLVYSYFTWQRCYSVVVGVFFHKKRKRIKTILYTNLHPNDIISRFVSAVLMRGSKNDPCSQVYSI